MIFGSAWFYGGVSRTQLVLPEFDLARLWGMTLYEITSLAIDLAILILAALSVFSTSQGQTLRDSRKFKNF